MKAEIFMVSAALVCGAALSLFSHESISPRAVSQTQAGETKTADASEKSDTADDLETLRQEVQELRRDYTRLQKTVTETAISVQQEERENLPLPEPLPGKVEAVLSDLPQEELQR